MFTNFENMSKQIDKAIKFFFLTQGITLRNRNKLKRYLKGLLREEGKKVDYINYIFCSDEHLLQINKQYLQHDSYTDIITFDLSDRSESIQAEIYVSIDRVKDNSRNLGVTMKSEILRVIFHGLLHLCGYNDKIKAEEAKMRGK